MTFAVGHGPDCVPPTQHVSMVSGLNSPLDSIEKLTIGEIYI